MKRKLFFIYLISLIILSTLSVAALGMYRTGRGYVPKSQREQYANMLLNMGVPTVYYMEPDEEPISGTWGGNYVYPHGADLHEYTRVAEGITSHRYLGKTYGAEFISWTINESNWDSVGTSEKRPSIQEYTEDAVLKYKEINSKIKVINSNYSSLKIGVKIVTVLDFISFWKEAGNDQSEELLSFMRAIPIEKYKSFLLSLLEKAKLSNSSKIESDINSMFNINNEIFNIMPTYRPFLFMKGFAFNFIEKDGDAVLCIESSPNGDKKSCINKSWEIF